MTKPLQLQSQHTIWDQNGTLLCPYDLYCPLPRHSDRSETSTNKQWYQHPSAKRYLFGLLLASKVDASSLPGLAPNTRNKLLKNKHIHTNLVSHQISTKLYVLCTLYNPHSSTHYSKWQGISLSRWFQDHHSYPAQQHHHFICIQQTYQIYLYEPVATRMPSPLRQHSNLSNIESFS